MQPRVADNLGHFPQVTWNEPRLERGLLWNRRRTYRAACGVEYRDYEETYQFRFWRDEPDRRDAGIAGVPIDLVQGFGIATADELYRSGAAGVSTKPDEYAYRDALVLYAQFASPWKGHAFLPMTYTSATKAQVMALHAVLTEVFIIQRPALLKAAQAAALQQRQEKREHLVGTSAAFAGQRFVPLQALPYADAAKANVSPAVSGEAWNVPEPYVTGARFGQLGSVSFGDLVRGKDRLFRVGKVITVLDPANRDKAKAGMIHFALFAAADIREAHRPRVELKDVRVLSGADITIPPDYLPFPDVVIDGATRVLCAEFTDGALLPMTQSVPGLALDFEKVRATLLDLARAGGHNPDGSRRNIKL